MPIRKIAPSIVSLSTYYGKTFVQTSPKVVNNSLAWLIRQINLALVSDSFINGVSMGDVYQSEVKAPYIYAALSSSFEKLYAGKDLLAFNYLERDKLVNGSPLANYEKHGRVVTGRTNAGEVIVVDDTDTFYVIGATERRLGDIYQVLQLKTEKKPFDFTEVRVFSKYIPVGIVLGYFIGLKSLLVLTGVKYRTVPARKNKDLAEHEFAIQFKDMAYVIDSRHRLGSLILAGFLDFDKSTKLYEADLFNHKDVYLNLMMARKMGAVYIRELEMMDSAFIDPISKEVLVEMGEPTTFKGLLLRATEMLLTYQSPVSQDRAVMRDRGYERFAGAVYRELTHAIRQFKNKNLVGRSKIDISPYQVWNSIMKEDSPKIVEDINPIQNLKESEVITFAGNGGRSKETMTKPSRAFHINDVGVLSESTVDNSGVGTVAYLSADPQIKNLRGMLKEDKELSPTSMLSTSALLSPCSTTDLAKRIMFITTQHSHTVPSSAYRQPMLRTGYEFMIGQRTSKMFCTAAEEDGKVISISSKGMIVEYKSGEKDGIPLDRVYGRAEGTVYPHDIVTPLKLGDRFKKGSVLAYNQKFFEPDFKDPSQVVMKTNATVNVAFMETSSTHEDSSTVSQELGELLQTEVTKVKSYVVKFEQSIHNLRSNGEKVSPRDILMLIEDEITSTAGNFSEDSVNTLKRLSHTAPRAGVSGIVERVEVFYHGDKRDMSYSLKAITDRSDAAMAQACRSTNTPTTTGRVSIEYRVSGTPLELDHAEIRIYITTKAPSGVGDKVIFGHQMKSTIAEVHRGEIRTDDGVPVDAIFSYRSVAARGAHSLALMGTTIPLLENIATRACNAYFGE